jgi:serine/threonine protein kinase
MMLKNIAFDKWVGITLGNYRLEQLMERSNWGPVFLARDNATSTSYSLRFLVGTPTNLTPKEHELYLESFLYRAGQIATLQHPNILPLLDYGVYRGLPYLVSPQIPMRPLRSRLARSGPLDVFTIGRYLDQISTALEYGHEHTVLHGNLSVDCIFIRLDGQLVVGDFGVRNMLESQQVDAGRNMYNEMGEVLAPEQLLGKPISPATDVYALGAALYYLLTGAPVFIGNTYDELAQQHLYASVPPLSRWRNDLPAGLYSIVARALAKDPAQRFHHPGALANAYHRIVAPDNKIRMPFIVPSTPVADMPLTERVWSPNGAAVNGAMNGTSRPVPQTPIPHSLHGFTNDDFLSPRPTLMRRYQRKNIWYIAGIAVLIALLVIATGAVSIVLLSQKNHAVSSVTGQVTFFTSQNGPEGQTDALRIAVHNLEVLPAGSEYAAWLVNQDTESITALGALTVKNQTGSLVYSETSDNLLNPVDKLEITQEQGAVQAPAGKVILMGTFPLKSFSHIEHVLVKYPPTPGKVGLLVGVLEQTHLLDIQAAVLQSATNARNTDAVGCTAQNIVNIIEGNHGSHYQQLAGICALQNVTAAGDAFGLLGKGYLVGTEGHAGYATGQPDATSAMHTHGTLLDIALSNITAWVTTIDQDAIYLRTHPDDTMKSEDIVRLADDAYHGVDVNGDGQVDPVAGEAGALTAFLQGQLMATLSLTSGA